MISENKFCIDCKYLYFNEDARWMDQKYWCRATVVTRVNYVTGDSYQTGTSSCFTMRKEDGKCGPEGKLWEPKL